MKLLKCVLLMICLFKKRAGKVLSSDLNKVNKIAMDHTNYNIFQLKLSGADKGELKQNHEPKADMVLRGVNLYESGKI